MSLHIALISEHASPLARPGTVDSGGQQYVIGGTALATTVNSGGSVTVSTGGIASGTVENFGGQWLQTRALEAHLPDRVRYPEFTDYTRLSMKRETELFFEHILRGDRSHDRFHAAAARCGDRAVSTDDLMAAPRLASQSRL